MKTNLSDITSTSKVAGIVVWYNPEVKECCNNIKSYIMDVEDLWIIDNSDERNEIGLLTQRFSNLNYIWLGGNKGIATALNIGFSEAIKKGYKWVLTMDQDSCSSENMVARLIQTAKECEREALNPGIVAAQPDTPTRRAKKKDGISLMDSVIASGNLVKVAAYKATGGFIDKLFIDAVDWEFSLGVRALGYKIIQDNETILVHHLGAIENKSFLGINMYPTNHSPIRFYYYSRNRLFVRDKYAGLFPMIIRREKLNYVKWWIKVLMYEKNKLQKILMAFKGYLDYKKNKFGKYEET